MSQTYHLLSDSDHSEPEDSPALSDIQSIESQLNSQSSISSSSSLSKSPKKRKGKNAAASELAKLKKLEKAAEKEHRKHILPATCLNYLYLHISANILGNATFTFLNNIMFNLIHRPIIVASEDDSIYWIRKHISGEEIKEPHLIILWDHIKLLNSIQQFTIKDYFSTLKKLKPTSRIYFVIYGLKDYCRRLRKKSTLSKEEIALKMKPSKNIIEKILCELQIISGIQSKIIDDEKELILFISQASKSVGEEPYKQEKAKTELEKRLYLQDFSRSCVRIGEQNFGMSRLWQMQLAQLPKSSLDCGKAISSVYPTPRALYQAYQSTHSITERENMLQNIIVGRTGSNKRVGPEMSKKISVLFSSNEEQYK